MKRVAVYCGTWNIFEQMCTSAKSLLYHNGADEIRFLTDVDIDARLPDCVTVMNVSRQPWFTRDGPNYHTRWTYMILLRAAYPRIFPDDVILSLDCDTIICGDISGIWRTDLSGKYYAAVRENITGHDALHYNFGVVLMNLAQLRDGTDKRIIHALNNTPFTSPEQDAYGLFCAGHIAELPHEYNVTWYNNPPVPEPAVKIRHYASSEPEEHDVRYRKFRRMPWDDVIARQIGLKGGQSQ